jgi:uncharacterized protein
MRSRLSWLIRMGGVVLLLIGVVYLRNLTASTFGRVQDMLSSLGNSAPSVAGVTSFIEESSGSTREVLVITDSDLVQVTVEEARTTQEKLTGLMYRDSLCSSCGMLFFNDTDTRGGFWMKNCEIALDVIFISKDKEVVDIKEQFEPCRKDPCPVFHPAQSYRYVLEVNGGWSQEHDLEIGDLVSF